MPAARMSSRRAAKASSLRAAEAAWLLRRAGGDGERGEGETGEERGFFGDVVMKSFDISPVTPD
ncbi:hypothetical protein APR48_27300 [Variovorax paradoxus]|nr:hypothetical protein APR49_11805 [Variovorax paradoxus]KPV27842.1 hypothetical protein APR48_27300 [Variovorax paradoxus]